MTELHELTVRLPTDLLTALESAARLEARSTDQIVQTALSLHLRELQRARDLHDAFAGGAPRD